MIEASKYSAFDGFDWSHETEPSSITPNSLLLLLLKEQSMLSSTATGILTTWHMTGTLIVELLIVILTKMI